MKNLLKKCKFKKKHVYQHKSGVYLNTCVIILKVDSIEFCYIEGFLNFFTIKFTLLEQTNYIIHIAGQRFTGKFKHIQQSNGQVVKFKKFYLNRFN